MKTSVESKPGLYRKLTIEVPTEKVASSFSRVYKDLQRNATIKGFRKGKAPIATIKSVYGDSVKKDVLQDIFSEAYSKAITEHKLQPVTQPSVNFEALSEDAPFTFTAEFEVHPEVELKKTEKLKVEKEKWSLDEAEVTKVLSSYQEQGGELVTVFEDRPAQKGDTVIIDFVGKIDGVPFEGGTAQDYNLELGSGNFIPGFEEGVEGMKVGAKKDLQLKFPTDYHAELAGKDVLFETTLKGLKKKSIPELNDAFAQKAGGFATIEEMKNDIRNRISEYELNRIKNDVRTRLIKKLVEENPLTIPETIQNEEKSAMMQDAWKNLSQRGMSETEFEEYKVKWDKDFSDAAAVKVKANFLIMSLAEKLNIQANKKEIDARIEKYAKQLGMDIEKVRSFYTKNNGGLSGLQYQIIEEKVVDHLIEKADVKEVPKESLEVEAKPN